MSPGQFSGAPTQGDIIEFLNFLLQLKNKRPGSESESGFSIIFIPKRTVLERRNLCFSSYENCKLKGKLWWAEACKRKKREFFVPFILPEGNFFNIWALSQSIAYWIHFRNIHTFTYQKTLLLTLFCLFLKSSKACSVSLRITQS